jgi:hypothetical protein
MQNAEGRHSPPATGNARFGRTSGKRQPSTDIRNWHGVTCMSIAPPRCKLVPLRYLRHSRRVRSPYRRRSRVAESPLGRERRPPTVARARQTPNHSKAPCHERKGGKSRSPCEHLRTGAEQGPAGDRLASALALAMPALMIGERLPLTNGFRCTQLSSPSFAATLAHRYARPVGGHRPAGNPCGLAR